MLGGPGRLRYGAALPPGTVMKASASLAFLLLLGAALAQDQATKPGSAYRSDIDAIVAALRHSAAEQHLPALGGDVATTAKILVAMANCQYVDGDSEELGNKRRHGASFDWKSTTASAGSTTITLVNATASYA